MLFNTERDIDRLIIKNRFRFLKIVSAIGVFLLSQIFFTISEATEWIPNYRKIDGILGDFSLVRNI